MEIDEKEDADESELQSRIWDGKIKLRENKIKEEEERIEKKQTLQENKRKLEEKSKKEGLLKIKKQEKQKKKDIKKEEKYEEDSTKEATIGLSTHNSKHFKSSKELHSSCQRR
jgi:hypothetical protein